MMIMFSLRMDFAKFIWEWNNGILGFILYGCFLLAFVIYHAIKISHKLKESRIEEVQTNF